MDSERSGVPLPGSNMESSVPSPMRAAIAAPRELGRRPPRRRRKKTSKLRRKRKEGSTTVDDLPDHLLELIFIRLGYYLCLVRVAVSCRRWHGVVADAGFLARFRLLHSPHVGEYRAARKRPFLFVPESPSATPVDADSRRFSLDFVPPPAYGGSWSLADSRGGVLLLTQKMFSVGSSVIVVCEPLARRYRRIPCKSYFTARGGVFLVDGPDAGRRTSVSNFKVIAAVHRFHVCVFSSDDTGDDGWRQVDSPQNHANFVFHVASDDFVGRSNGYLCWGISYRNHLLTLDESTAQFGLAVFPQNVWGFFHGRAAACRVIGGGALRVVRLTPNNVLKVSSRRQGADGVEWVLEMELDLPEATAGLPGREERFFKQRRARIIAANDRFVLVTPNEKKWVFTVELGTMKVDRAHRRNEYDGNVYPLELPWPPVLKLKP